MMRLKKKIIKKPKFTNNTAIEFLLLGNYGTEIYLILFVHISYPEEGGNVVALQVVQID